MRCDCLFATDTPTRLAQGEKLFDNLPPKEEKELLDVQDYVVTLSHKELQSSSSIASCVTSDESFKWGLV